MDARQYDKAISHYATTLSLDPPLPRDILVKRIKACIEIGHWKEVADDANQVYHFSVMKVNLVDESSGHRARSVFAIGL